jgi:hypothetical protein
MDRQKDFERRAAQCRRLARDVTDDLTAERLNLLAKEFDAKAKALSSPEKPNKG